MTPPRISLRCLETEPSIWTFPSHWSIGDKIIHLNRKGTYMATLITGLGLVGTSYAQVALKRGESIVFVDIAPRKDFLANKLGADNVTVVQRDVRDLPALIEIILKNK